MQEATGLGAHCRLANAALAVHPAEEAALLVETLEGLQEALRRGQDDEEEEEAEAGAAAAEAIGAHAAGCANAASEPHSGEGPQQQQQQLQEEEGDGEEEAVVVLHGIGLGLAPYLRLLARLASAALCIGSGKEQQRSSDGQPAPLSIRRRPWRVVAVQYRHVSMRLTRRIPAAEEVAADVIHHLRRQVGACLPRFLGSGGQARRCTGLKLCRPQPPCIVLLHK